MSKFLEVKFERSKNRWPKHIVRCSICNDAADTRYNWISPDLKICGECICKVANIFQYAHSGRWLTWENPKSVTKNKKEKIPNALRKQVFERDKYRCVNCQTHVDLCADHIFPESLGGETSLSNLQTLCRSCNSSKGVRT